MSDTETAMHAINTAATTKVNSAIGGTLTNGSIAGGSVAAANNPEILGNYLSTHYFGVLSYSELIAVIGATWVMIQILKTIVPFIINLVRNIMPKKPVKPTSTQSTEVKVKKPTKTPKAPA